MFLRPSTPPQPSNNLGSGLGLSLSGLGGQGQRQKRTQDRDRDKDRAVDALAQLAREALQHINIHDQEQDQDQLGVEVLLQLIGHLIRKGIGNIKTNKEENKTGEVEVTILAPETQQVEEEQEEGEGIKKKKRKR